MAKYVYFQKHVVICVEKWMAESYSSFCNCFSLVYRVMMQSSSFRKCRLIMLNIMTIFQASSAVKCACRERESYRPAVHLSRERSDSLFS
nr:AlNc14C61G4451 [Albugo laibachii Nc14]|eukprot:CCA18994.1 AlNc14C61G4451 [Albugo laibachii Nc14]